MKWPSTLTFIRHGESAYNANKKKVKATPLFQEFKKRFNEEFAQAKDENWVSNELRFLAREVWELLRTEMPYGACETPLNEIGHQQAKTTGAELLRVVPKPDVIYVSPYLRAQQTLTEIQESEPRIAGVKVIEDERIREQEYGLGTVFRDWRVYHVFNPMQALLLKLESEYDFRFLNGESKADTRDRARSFVATLVREYAGRDVLVVSHHLTILCLRANLERWNREQFIQVDKNDAPVNCGVTTYRCEPDLGKNGKLILEAYNQKLY